MVARPLLSDRERHPRRVDIIAFTHLRVDHVGWNRAFPDAHFVFAEAEWRWMLGRSDCLALTSRSCCRRPATHPDIAAFVDRA